MRHVLASRLEDKEILDQLVTITSEFSHELVTILNEGEMEEGQEVETSLLERYKNNVPMNRRSKIAGLAKQVDKEAESLRLEE